MRAYLVGERAVLSTCMHGGSSVAISVPGRVTCILLVLLALLGDPAALRDSMALA